MLLQMVPNWFFSTKQIPDAFQYLHTQSKCKQIRRDSFQLCVIDRKSISIEFQSVAYRPARCVCDVAVIWLFVFVWNKEQSLMIIDEKRTGGGSRSDSVFLCIWAIRRFNSAETSKLDGIFPIKSISMNAIEKQITFRCIVNPFDSTPTQQ